MRIRLGTRGSALARAQTALVAGRLRELHAGLEVETLTIRTSGDETASGGKPPPSGPEDKSRFVKELEEALLEERVDLAVHSAKDVPGELPEGLAIVAVPERADPRDALCGAGALAELGEGSTVGTSSLRRRSQLLALRPDLRVEELRGNVDTRLGRLDRGEYAAIVVAAAGLERLGRSEGRPLDPGDFTPAPGQGCLMLEARAADATPRELAEPLVDRRSLLELTAERGLVEGLEATCRTPIGAHAVLAGDALALTAFCGLPDGSVWIRDSAEGPAGEPAALGRAVAERMLLAGAGELLAAADGWEVPG